MTNTVMQTQPPSPQQPSGVPSPKTTEVMVIMNNSKNAFGSRVAVFQSVTTQLVSVCDEFLTINRWCPSLAATLGKSSPDRNCQ